MEINKQTIRRDHLNKTKQNALFGTLNKFKDLTLHENDKLSFKQN